MTMEDSEERLNDYVPDSVIIRMLARENKKLRIQLGKERSYIQELEYNLNYAHRQMGEIKDCRKEARREVLKEDMYKILKNRVQALTKENRMLRETREILLKKISSLLPKNKK